jgi:propanediol utilization protein
MKINIGISNRHVHLNKKDFKILFGLVKFAKHRDLTQPGEYASIFKVSVEANNKIIENIRVVGPCRKYTQVELLKSDALYLEINPPMRQSGDLKESSLVTIIGPLGGITKECAIIAERHIHLDLKDLKNIKNPEIKVLTKEGQIIDHIKIKRHKNYVREIHLDRDDGTLFNINNGDEVELIDQ